MIRILTDSMADLPAYILEEFGITIMPAYISFGSETLRDHLDISPTRFYERLAQSPELPTTAQPSVDDFVRTYQQMLTETPDATILSIHVSESLSGTLASARQAAAMLPDAPIKILDSRLVSMGLGILAHEAALMIRAGAQIHEITTRLSSMRQTMAIYYTVDTLDYLYKGGRIGRAALFFGTLLDVKPILTLQNGAVAPYERHRLREKAIERMEELTLEAGMHKKHIHLGVAHAACEEDARAFAERLREALNPEVLLISQIGPAVGTYTGPGSLGAFIWGE